MALQSKFKLNQKLQDCAVADSDHIGETTMPPESRSGAHVGLIHEALNAWASRQNPAVTPVASGEVSARVFGRDTSRVVTLFKTSKRILNFRGEIDPIVGIKTVAALDLELPAIKEPDPIPARKVADVVVRFQGAFAEGELTPDSVLSGRRVIIYKPMPDQPFGASVLLHPFNGRALIRVGRKTATIGNDSRRVFVEVAARLLGQIGVLGMTPGKIFIHGSSSGGRNAIDFAAHLSALGLKPFFVAAVDAAFFQANTPSRPEGAVDRPRAIPAFTVNAGVTPNRVNFFQTLGNHSKRTLRQGVLFSSSMKGEEIHGTIAGFQNNDLTRFIPRPLLISDDDAHGECGARGSAEAERLIADELLLRT